MGRFHEYKCDNCGYEISYRTGCGFFTFEDYTKRMSVEKEKLKKEILDKKYGEHLKKVIESDESSFVFSCNEEL